MSQQFWDLQCVYRQMRRQSKTEITLENYCVGLIENDVGKKNVLNNFLVIQPCVSMNKQNQFIHQFRENFDEASIPQSNISLSSGMILIVDFRIICLYMHRIKMKQLKLADKLVFFHSSFIGLRDSTWLTGYSRLYVQIGMNSVHYYIIL